MRYTLLFICLSSISCFGQQTDTMLLIQKSHYEWFVEQTVDNIANKQVILKKDSTIHDLNDVVVIIQDEVLSLKRDSTKAAAQNATLVIESSLLQSAFNTQNKAVTQLKKEKATLKLAGLSLAGLVILALIHPW